MTGHVKIRKVDDARDFRRFREFPWHVYANDPHWVPPLLSMRRDLLEKRRNPDWDYMEGDYFIALRDEQIVGTIAAFVNHRHNEFNHEHIGWFGAFEALEDQEAATNLLDTACRWVTARGYDVIRGPQTFTTHQDCGVLVDGFTRPVLLMPYNYPYYQRLIENAGFEKQADLYSFHMSRQDSTESGMSDRLNRITQSVMKRNKITIRPIDRKRIREEFELFKDIYNAAWDDTWGHVPMTQAELDTLVESPGRYFDPDFAFFAYVDGVPAGFVMGIPDFYQVLQKANARPGVPEIITLLRAVWYWKVNSVIDWIRIALLGVKPEYRNKGVDVALYWSMMQACVESSHIKHSDAGWILDSNDSMLSVARNLGLDPYKTHRLYEKSLKVP